jgi:hypothetical protein
MLLAAYCAAVIMMHTQIPTIDICTAPSLYAAPDVILRNIVQPAIVKLSSPDKKTIGVFIIDLTIPGPVEVFRDMARRPTNSTDRI